MLYRILISLDVTAKSTQHLRVFAEAIILVVYHALAVIFLARSPSLTRVIPLIPALQEFQGL